jgi:hypothetical protein
MRRAGSRKPAPRLLPPDGWAEQPLRLRRVIVTVDRPTTAVGAELPTQS